MRKDFYTNGSIDIPKISKKRSFFDLSHSSHLDMVPGNLYPIDQVIDVLPGDTFDYSHRLNIRMTNPPKVPTMDLLVLDLYWFYVPNRIVMHNWDELITNSGSSFYVDSVVEVPYYEYVSSSNGAAYQDIKDFSVFDYLGYSPVSLKGSNSQTKFNPSLLPVRGYYMIWNEYFRYESLQTEILIDYDDTNSSYSSGLPSSATYNYYTFNAHNDAKWNYCISYKNFRYCLAPVNRLPGYFSRALPKPVGGDEVKIFRSVQIGYDAIDSVQFNFDDPVSSGLNLVTNGSAHSVSMKAYGSEGLNSISGTLHSSDNSIRALSNAFALNKFLYIDNVYGKRITEWTYGHFGIQVPDSRVQRPEFLAKKRVYININQIMQSSETSATSPQGNAGAWSQTYDQGHDFVKSFVEYGYLFALGCIRVLNHTFPRGISKTWTRRSQLDFYLPEFNNIGDQEVKKYEIYGSSATPDATFGYQERYAEYKMIPSKVSGFMKPDVTGTLAVYNYSDYYTTTPSLSATWMFEPIENIERTMFFNFETASPFIMDYVCDLKAYRSMPYNSQPGGLTGSW